MSSTPPPPAPDATGNGDDWRKAVLQSYRNDEVREIAKVLAALEPGASASSKLALAMRFEDTIFKSADSLADYRKKLTKRLKKLRKNYVPPAQPKPQNTQEQLLLSLRKNYGDSLRYIAKNSEKAIADVRSRHGSEKSNQLQQHTDSAIKWAKELCVLEAQQPDRNKLSESHLQKLRQHLERRVENIRQYVVKHADPDMFLQETLERKDQELNARACHLLGVNLSKRIQQLQSVTSFNALAVLQDSLEKAQTSVPPPTRNNANDIPAALMHLEKMRAASTALMAYLAIPDRKTTAPRNSLAKAHTIATQGMDFVTEVAKKQPEPKDANQVSLQDAWTKVLELPMETEEDAVTTKRPKLDHIPPVTRSRVLLKPKRKIPSNFLPALKRKRAELVRPAPDGRGSHLILEFGNAFVMTIYFSPLVVTLRAFDESASKSKHTKSLGCASWSPLYQGLTNKEDLEVWGVKGSYDQIGHVLEERLRDASNHATHTLRKCFRNHVKDKTTDFEVEILEASALIQFVQLARTTYVHKWQDDE